MRLLAPVFKPKGAKRPELEHARADQRLVAVGCRLQHNKKLASVYDSDRRKLFGPGLLRRDYSGFMLKTAGFPRDYSRFRGKVEITRDYSRFRREIILGNPR